MIRRSLAVAGLVVGGLALSPKVDAAAVPAWTVIELQPLVDGDSTHVRDINDAGIAIGASDGVAVRWNAAGEPTALAQLEGCRAFPPRDISNSGHIVSEGYCNINNTNKVGAFLWAPDGTPTFLPQFRLGDAVEDNGIMTGVVFIDTEPGFPPHAIAYLAGHPVLRLPEAGANGSVTGDLTNWGYVVGTLAGVPTLPQDIAVGWYGDQVFPLLFTATNSSAIAVTESGVALVHTYANDNRPLRGYLVAPGGAVTSLDTSGDADLVQDVNDAGIVVGTKILDDAGTAATTDDDAIGAFYVGTQWVALENTLSTADQIAFDLSQPIALNDNAWVVGNARGGAWLLKPPVALPGGDLPHTGASVAK